MTPGDTNGQDLADLLRTVRPEMMRELADLLRSEPPDIPALPPGDAREAVSALANAAFLYRGVFLQLAEGKPLDAIFEERVPYLIMADKVITSWCAALGIEADDD